MKVVELPTRVGVPESDAQDNDQPSAKTGG